MPKAAERNAVGGMVYTEESVPDELPSVGEIISVNDQDHVVLNITAHYKIERDEWQIVLKLSSLGTASIESDDAPEWVTEKISDLDD